MPKHRTQFGRRSERISDEQIELAQEDVETQNGIGDAAAEGMPLRKRPTASSGLRARKLAAPIAVIFLPIRRARRSSSNPRPRPVRAAVVLCTTSVRMCPNGSIRSRRGCA